MSTHLSIYIFCGFDIFHNQLITSIRAAKVFKRFECTQIITPNRLTVSGPCKTHDQVYDIGQHADHMYTMCVFVRYPFTLFLFVAGPIRLIKPMGRRALSLHICAVRVSVVVRAVVLSHIASSSSDPPQPTHKSINRSPHTLGMCTRIIIVRH